jgi:hypothetical protein
MQRDTVVRDGVGTFADLHITPHSLEESLPHCLAPGSLGGNP